MAPRWSPPVWLRCMACGASPGSRRSPRGSFLPFGRVPCPPPLRGGTSLTLPPLAPRPFRRGRRRKPFRGFLPRRRVRRTSARRRFCRARAVRLSFALPRGAAGDVGRAVRVRPRPFARFWTRPCGAPPGPRPARPPPRTLAGRTSRISHPFRRTQPCGNDLRVQPMRRAFPSGVGAISRTFRSGGACVPCVPSSGRQPSREGPRRRSSAVSFSADPAIFSPSFGCGGFCFSSP